DALKALKASIPLKLVITTLEHARDYNQSLIGQLDVDVNDINALNAATNALSADHDDKLTSLSPIIKQLEDLFGDLSVEEQKPLAVIIATMRQKGLGVGTVHFRLNAAQINNAIRRRLQDVADFDEKSLSSLTTMSKLLREVKPVKVSFASLATETTTALRQFIVMAQILKHVDATSPIRMLIAECDHAITVMVALYFARLFGIADKVDVSPLFETENALEHGARILDTLLGDVEVQKAARLRGRLCIQAGFSDAGRFFGQIPATLAIERLQGHFARLMAKHGLNDVTALIFNTHGESMGRGAHPSSVTERLDYAFSPWAARQFEKEDVPVETEVSFQGGDGYVRFGSYDLALAFLTRVLEARNERNIETADDDPFYSDLDVSLDFYRAVRRYQVQLWDNTSYNRALTAFGLALLPVTGSRKSRRQSDIANNTGAGLSRIRAIPHNAVLQQLGYPLNVIAGIGEATDYDHDRFISLIKRSDRARILMKMVFGAKRLSSIKTLVSYGQLFDGAYWATRPYAGFETRHQEACLELAEMLTGDDRTPAFRSLATLLRVDSTKLHKVLDAVFEKEHPPQKDALAVLHAIRQALIQHMFLRAVQIPPFSRRNDMSREDIIRMLFDLRIDEVVALLKDSYPVDHP
ncbi:MAG: phosphoenolpyruvate carboxylase, partial [Sphingomonadales bacterium]|nr:phosphoenolpyruvate carboxylase [Sphingomonadales bacterium]